MQTGFITFETVTYDEAIPAAAEFGFDYVEIMVPYAGGGNELGREFLADHADRIRTHLEETGIELLVHLPHAVDIAAPSERIREAGVEEVTENLRIASDLGARKAVVHPTSSARPRVWDDTVVREWILESARELDAVAGELGVELCMENIPGTRFPVHEFDRFFAETDCSMTLDTGHARISGFDADDIAAFLETNADRVSHVHVNDNKQFVVGTGGSPADDHVPTGSGDLPFARALGPLVSSDWEGTLSLEVQTGNLAYVEFSKEQLELQLAAARRDVSR